MKNEKTASEVQGTKRLSLEDFKLDKINGSEVVSATDLHNAMGGVSQDVSVFVCTGPDEPMDDCHS